MNGPSARFLFAHGFGQHAGIVLGMLLEVFHRHAVIGELRIARERLVFLDDLLRRSADLAFGPGTVEDAVDDVADRAPVILVPRPFIR